MALIYYQANDDKVFNQARRALLVKILGKYGIMIDINDCERGINEDAAN